MVENSPTDDIPELLQIIRGEVLVVSVAPSHIVIDTRQVRMEFVYERFLLKKIRGYHITLILFLVLSVST